MTQQENRKYKIQMLVGIIRNIGTIDEEKLIAIAMSRFGSAKRTIKEYLGQLVLTDVIVRDQGTISIKKDENQSTLTTGSTSAE